MVVDHTQSITMLQQYAANSYTALTMTVLQLIKHINEAAQLTGAQILSIQEGTVEWQKEEQKTLNVYQAGNPGVPILRLMYVNEPASFAILEPNSRSTIKHNSRLEGGLLDLDIDGIEILTKEIWDSLPKPHQQRYLLQTGLVKKPVLPENLSDRQVE